MTSWVPRALLPFALLCSAPDAALAQLHVLCSGGARAAYDAALPSFEKASGIAVTTLSGSSQGDGPTTIGAQLRTGTHADVVIMSREGLDDLVAAGKIIKGTEVDLAQTPLAMAVRAGARHPDISTVEAFTRALLDAKSITMQASTTGIYMTKTLFPRLGISDALSKKLSFVGVAAVARGEAELALQPLSELIHAAGAEVVGNVPADVQFLSVFSAAVVAGAQHADAAKQLIAALASPQADAAVRDSGMERPTRH